MPSSANRGKTDGYRSSCVGIGVGLFLSFFVAFSPLYLRGLVGVTDARILAVLALLVAIGLLVFSYPRRAVEESDL